MATELFFTPIPDLPLPLVKFPKYPHRLPPFSLPTPAISSGHLFLKNVSGSKVRLSSSIVVHAVQEEVVQTPNSDFETAPPSSKLVLVVGGSGGVGRQVSSFYSALNICSHFVREF